MVLALIWKLDEVSAPPAVGGHSSACSCVLSSMSSAAIDTASNEVMLTMGLVVLIQVSVVDLVGKRSGRLLSMSVNLAERTPSERTHPVSRCLGRTPGGWRAAMKLQLLLRARRACR